MRILMVSMNSIHFQRWTDQLKDSGHEIFWFDVRDGAKVRSLSWVKSYQGWQQKSPNFKGKHFIKIKLPKLYKAFENDTAKAFEKVLLEVQPDAVHSFVLYISCTPILSVMKRHKNIKWIYSSWGSDLFYFKNIPEYKKGIIEVLPNINYLITDCKRDVLLAKELGFNGKVLGTFPGGGGYDFSVSDKHIKTPILERNIILIKGYQGRSGRAIEVLKALELLVGELKEYKIVVFGADLEVKTFLNHNNRLQKLDITIYLKSEFLAHETILKLMGKALIYIGNSNSDGMPNTMLEALIMGAFVIQSNPGGATEEIIINYKNGLLIEDCDSVKEIREHIYYVLNDLSFINDVFDYNQKKIKPHLERGLIVKQVRAAYNTIMSNV